MTRAREVTIDDIIEAVREVTPSPLKEKMIEILGQKKAEAEQLPH
jgi:hypothetical protein